MRDIISPSGLIIFKLQLKWHITYILFSDNWLFSSKELSFTLNSEYTDNVRKEKYICTIFTVLINLYVNSRHNDFHNLMIITIIVFQNTQENIKKTVSKSAPQSSII